MNVDCTEAKRLVRAVIDGSAREADVKKLAHETMAIVGELERAGNGLHVEQDKPHKSGDSMVSAPTLGTTAVYMSFEQPLDNLNAVLAEVDRRYPVWQFPTTAKTEPFYWDSDRLAATVARELRQMIAGALLRLPSEADVARFLCDVSFGAGAYDEMSRADHDARPGVFNECKREARLLLGFVRSRSLIADDARITEAERITMKNERDRALARLRAWEIGYCSNLITRFVRARAAKTSDRPSVDPVDRPRVRHLGQKSSSAQTFTLAFRNTVFARVTYHDEPARVPRQTYQGRTIHVRPIDE